MSGSLEPLIVDIDLSILGQPRDVFERYEDQIRDEYAWATPASFAVGRCCVLQAFIDRTSIYRLKRFRSRYEKVARENLAWAIERQSKMLQQTDRHEL